LEEIQSLIENNWAFVADTRQIIMKISLLITCLIATVRGIDLFGDLFAFKEDIINGIRYGIHDHAHSFARLLKKTGIPRVIHKVARAKHDILERTGILDGIHDLAWGKEELAHNLARGKANLIHNLARGKAELIHDVVEGKAALINSVFGKGKCGCPCRDYYVPKCEMTYVQQCYTEHYEQVCHSIPVPKVIQVKEIECQKCRKYKVPVPKTKWVKECNPVYDEKCKTEYHQHCKEETRCHQLYQTICDNSGYQQHCESQPRQHCYPETKCHRTPETKCVPVQKDKCTKVPVETTQYVEQKQCLAFELDLAHMSAHHGDPCASYDQGVINAQDHHGHHEVVHHQTAHHQPAHHQVAHHQVSHQQISHQPLAPNSGYQANFQDQYNTGHSTIIPNDQYIQPTFTQQVSAANNYGVQDPILQHQPITNQYGVNVRESPKKTYAVGNDNPFLRRPKSVQVTVKRVDNLHKKMEDDGWIPIPYPIYKK